MKTDKTTSGLSQAALNDLAEANERLTLKHKNEVFYDDLLEIKASKARKEASLRPLLLNIGMAVSILMAIIAINWKTYDTGDLLDLGKVQGDLNEIIEIPISSQPPPPPPPKSESFTITEVKDEEIIEDLDLSLDVEVTEDQAMEVVEFVEPEEVVEEEVVDEIFMIVEEQPMPKGGLESFYAYLAEALVYPPKATRLGISGSVFVQFVVEKDGSISNVELAKGIGAGCDEEAMRVIANAPAWNPGKQRGIPVRVSKIIPVKFILANAQQ